MLALAPHVICHVTNYRTHTAAVAPSIPRIYTATTNRLCALLCFALTFLQYCSCNYYLKDSAFDQPAFLRYKIRDLHIESAEKLQNLLRFIEFG